MAKINVIFIGDLTSKKAVDTLWVKFLKVVAKAKLQVAFGRCSSKDAAEALLTTKASPIPFYLQDSHTISAWILSNESTAKHAESNGVDQGVDDDKSPCLKLGHNFYVLRDKPSQQPRAGIWSIPIGGSHHDLVVASLPPRYRAPITAGETASSFENSTNHSSFVGCDILVSTEWPQGIEASLATTTLDTSQLVSYDVGMAALRARAQYHIATAGLAFCQTPAFAHTASISSTIKLSHSGRFIALPNVESPISDKWLHAVAILPLHAITKRAEEAHLLPCPYLLMMVRQQNDTNLNEITARRLIAEEADQRSGSRKRVNAPLDPTNTTLFVYGLHQDVSGRLQKDDAILLKALPGAISVRRHHAFCFVEFSSHDAAAACLGERSVFGVRLQCRWSDATDQHQKKRRTKEDPISTVLYFKVVDERANKNSNNTLLSIEKIGETLRSWMEQVLEDELGGDVKAADEPAIQVKVRTSSAAAFGFLDFASHAAASMTLATLTGSTDGGRLEDKKRQQKSEFENMGIYMHWGKPEAQTRNQDDKESNFVESAGEFRFERKQFPADSRKDCWFCLASPACEQHLIVGVFNSCYAAQPKGPCHPGHILLVPVQHDSSGAFTNVMVASEMEGLKHRLLKHAWTEYDSDLFIFERAMQTKGGYHTHVQCVPIPKGTGPKIRATMLAQANRQKFDLREIGSDVPMHTMVGEYGYLFAQILTENSSERFLCSDTASGVASRVPLQFGREVLAAVLEQPDLAHWKSCVMDHDKEIKVAAEFRKTFAKFVDED